MSSQLREPIEEDIVATAEFLKEALGKSIADAEHFVFDNENPQHLLTVCIYATILQSAHDCSILLEEETVTIVGGALRGIVESWADLVNVIADADYGQRMTATFAHEKKRYFQSMLEYPQNPFFANMAKHLDAQTQLKATDSEIDKLKNAGFEKLSNKARLDLANLTDIHRAFYWQLCLESHNSAAMLQMRHMEQDDAGTLKITMFAKTTSIQRINLLDPLVAILLDVGKRTHEFFRTGAAPSYEQRRAAYEVLRQKVLANSKPLG